MGPPPKRNGNEQMTDATKPFRNNASMKEKHETLKQDTLLSRQRGEQDLENSGRHAATNKAKVFGADTMQYPNAAPNWACDPVPQEPSLGFSVEDHEAVGEVHEILASCGAAPADLPPAVEPSPQGSAPTS